MTSIEIGARYRHVKRGTVYEVLGRARMQIGAATMRSIGVHEIKTHEERIVAELEKRTFIVYVTDDDERTMWVRPETEFCDGRFVLIREVTRWYIARREGLETTYYSRGKWVSDRSEAQLYSESGFADRDLTAQARAVREKSRVLSMRQYVEEKQ